MYKACGILYTGYWTRLSLPHITVCIQVVECCTVVKRTIYREITVFSSDMAAKHFPSNASTDAGAKSLFKLSNTDRPMNVEPEKYVWTYSTLRR